MSPTRISPLSGLLLAGQHARERRLAGAVRADDADDAAGRQLEGEVVDQKLSVIGLGEMLDVDDDIAEPRAGRDDDLRLAALQPRLVGLQELVIGLDARLRLGAARFRRAAHPFALALDDLLARVVLALLLRHALRLLVQIGGVVPLVGDAAAAIELEDPAGDVVEEVAVVGDDQNGAGEKLQVLLEPADGLRVEMVGRLVEEQQVGLFEQQLAERDAALLAARERRHVGVAGRTAERLHRHLDLRFEVPEVLGVDLVLQLRGFLRRLVGVVHHQLVIAVEDRLLRGDAEHDVALHVERRRRAAAPAAGSRRARPAPPRPRR